MNKTPGMIADKDKGTVAGVPGRSFTASTPVVVQRKSGHLERPPSQGNAVGLKGKDCC